MSYEVKLDGQEVEIDLADLAGLEMDDIQAEAGGFEATPKGYYTFEVKDAKLHEIADKPVVGFALEVVECHAVASESETVESMVGKTHEENIFVSDVKKDIGRAKFIMQEAGFVGEGSLNNQLDGFCGHRFLAKIKNKAKKDDPDTIYANLDFKSIKPVPTEG